MKATPLAVRFWRHVEVAGPEDCWLWQGARTTNFRRGFDYGVIGRGGRGAGNLLAHRVSYELNVGPIPTGKVVCHHCDNPPCVNPAHLFLGTHRDNFDDMRRKGRHRSLTGEAHPRPNALLNEADVVAIRLARSRGERAVDLAARYDVKPNTIWAAANGRNWGHVAIIEEEGSL